MKIMGIKTHVDKDENGRWIIISDELNLYSVGKTLEKARINFVNALELLMEMYMFESDEKLTDKAKEFKRKLEVVINEKHK